MKDSIAFIVSIGIVCVVAFGCSNDDVTTVTPQTTGDNLLSNSSFELGDRPSLDGWQPQTTDTSFVSIVADAPPNGGRFSARLRNEWTFAGSITARAALASGTHRLRLSVWAKSARARFSHGNVWLGIQKRESLLYRKNLLVADSVWTFVSLLDTVTTNVGDSVVVRLSGDIRQFAGGYSLFDVCRLEKLDK